MIHSASFFETGNISVHIRTIYKVLGTFGLKIKCCIVNILKIVETAGYFILYYPLRYKSQANIGYFQLCCLLQNSQRIFFNPLHTGRLFHSYMLDESIVILEVSGSILSF